MRRNRRVRTSVIKRHGNGYYTEGYRWTAVIYDAGRPVRVLWKTQPRVNPGWLIHPDWAGIA